MGVILSQAPGGHGVYILTPEGCLLAVRRTVSEAKEFIAQLRT